MFKKLMHGLIGLTLAAGIVAASVQPADAHRRGGAFAAGVATGVIGLGLLGAITHSRDRTQHYYYGGGGCHEGPKRCAWRGQHCFHNRYGEWVCRGGHYSCWRPTYCED